MSPRVGDPEGLDEGLVGVIRPTWSWLAGGLPFGQKKRIVNEVVERIEIEAASAIACYRVMEGHRQARPGIRRTYVYTHSPRSGGVRHGYEGHPPYVDVA